MHLSKKNGNDSTSLKVDGTVSHNVYKNSRLRLEYAYLLFNKLIMKRMNSEIKIKAKS